MILCAHQPNLFPHEGLIEKIRASDVCVILNHVQFPKGKYVNRFSHQGQWFTLAVTKGLVPIIDKHYVNPNRDWAVIHDKLRGWELPPIPWSTHVPLHNIQVWRWLMERLDITTPLTGDAPSPLTATSRLVDLCLTHGADTYLAGPSGKNYLDERLFQEAGVRVVYQEAGLHRSGLEVLRDA